MGSACRYWTHVRLEASGTLRERSIAAAQSFFQQQFPDWAETEDLPDLQIQRQLVTLMQAVGLEFTPTLSRLAECCLRCFVSHQIPIVCFSLEQQFGQKGGYGRADLYPYVMDDADPLSTEANRAGYLPLAVRIVQSFDPEQSNLSTWTKRLVLQHKDLNAALADYGIYLASDWAILNHTSPARVRRLLAGVLMAAELQRRCQVLDSFHAIYRQARQQQRQAGESRVGKKCIEPTPEQLQQMLLYLQAQGVPETSPQRILHQLRDLAQRLRQLRRSPDVSLDNEKTSFLAEQQQMDDLEDEQEQDQFLILYRQESEQCLNQAVQQVVDARVAYLNRRKPPKGHLFVKALDLFHCQGKSMTEIAPLVELEKQFQVSRLLELKEFRSDVKQKWLKLLHQRLLQLLKDYVDSQQLEQLDRQLQQRLLTALENLIDQTLSEDATDSYSPKRNTRSLFTACLCQYLKTWRN